MTTRTIDGVTFVTDPLTTIFTPAAWCSTRLYTSTDDGSGGAIYVRDLAIQNPNLYGPLGRTSNCYVPNVPYHHSPSVSGEYSPGVCPIGYTGTLSNIEASPATTTVWCCPVGMTLNTLVPGGCTSVVTTPTTVALNAGDFTTITKDFVAADYFLIVNWAASDLSKFMPSGAPTLARMTNPSASSSQPGSTPENHTPSNTNPASDNASGGDHSADGEGSLSTGSEAGIGVGVAIALIAILAVIVWLLLKRRKRRRTTGYASKDNETDSHAMPFKEDSSAYASYDDQGYRTTEGGQVYHKGDEWSSNLTAPDVRGSQGNRAELAGGWEGYEMDNRQPAHSKR